VKAIHKGSVTDVVDRASEQGYASGIKDNNELKDRRDGQDHERPFDRPDTALRRTDARIDQAMRVAMAACVTVRVTVRAVTVVAIRVAEPAPFLECLKHPKSSICL
jgi:hypothetical protein